MRVCIDQARQHRLAGEINDLRAAVTGSRVRSNPDNLAILDDNRLIR
jgi:hypothetical protein